MSTYRNLKFQPGADPIEEMPTFQQETGISDTELTNDTTRGLAALTLRLQQLELLVEQQAAALAQAQGLPNNMAKVEEAIRENISQREKLLEDRPQLSAEEKHKIIAQAEAAAATAAVEKKKRFLNKLKTAPTAEVNNTTGQGILFQIQGVKGIIKAGLNKNVPLPFAQAYQDHINAVDLQVRRNAAIAVDAEEDRLPEMGMLNNWIHEGREGEATAPQSFGKDIMEFD